MLKLVLFTLTWHFLLIYLQLHCSYSILAVQDKLETSSAAALFDLVGDVGFSPLPCLNIDLPTIPLQLLRDSDGEVVYRSLVALGNLVRHISPPCLGQSEVAYLFALLAQSLSSKFSSSMPAAGLARYKALAKDAVKRLPESRNKAIMVEIERGAR